MGNSTKYLKAAKSGRVFIRTDELAKRADMVPCTVKGQLLTGHVAEAETAANGVRESKYIGLLVDGEPGRLFHYTEQLAKKSNAVSIDDPAQWNGDKSNVVADLENGVSINPTESDDDKSDSDSDVIPALSRNTDNTSESQDKPDVSDVEGDETPVDPVDPVETQGNVDEDNRPDADFSDVLSVPDVSNVEGDEAKSILCQWAFNNFDVNLNRTYGAERMTEECQKLLDNALKDVAS